MNVRVRNIFVLVLLACALCSCGKEGKVIPRRTMSKIYADMAMADAIIQNRTYDVRRTADTSLVYEAIFRKYGYTSEDYLASQQKYINDAGRYVRMVKKAVLQLESDKKELVAEQKRLKDLLDKAAGVKRHAPNRIYLMDTLDLADTVWFDFDFQQGLDTAFAGPQVIVWADTVGQSEAKDSLALEAAAMTEAEPAPKVDSKPVQKIETKAEPKAGASKPAADRNDKPAAKVAAKIMEDNVKVQ